MPMMMCIHRKLFILFVFLSIVHLFMLYDVRVFVYIFVTIEFVKSNKQISGNCNEMSSPNQHQETLVVFDGSAKQIYEYPVLKNLNEDDFPDDNSLAAKDALALRMNDLDEEPHHDSKKKSKRRRLIALLALAGFGILILVIVLATVLPKKSKDSTFQQGDMQDVVSVVDSVEEVMSILEPLVEEPSLLTDPTTPEGKAFEIVSTEQNLSVQDVVIKYALLTLYFATDGENWKNNDGWVSSQSTDTCSWYGIFCDGNGDVLITAFDNNDLDGPVPSSICLLPNVKMIILSANNLIGSLPPCISTSMTSLKELHINGNKFSGALPTGLHQLPNLTRLTLSFNDFNGNVDSLFSDVQSGDPIFQKLRTLSLHNNNLSGSVPDTNLSKVTSLKALTIGNNPNLSGSLSTFCNAVGVNLASADCDIDCPCCADCR